MSTSPLEVKNPYTYTKSQASQYNTANSSKKNIENKTLQGVLLNNFIKKQSVQSDLENFDRISSSLLIPEDIQKQPVLSEDKKDDFNAKKLIKPLAATAVVSIGMIGVISGCLKNYSKLLSSKADLVRPEDLAININLLEETDLSLYKMLRDPKAKNIAGFLGVVLMSAVGVICKNFVQGAREIWVKKQNCDIEHDLAENLIQVETDVFSGKLNVVNTMLSDTTKYFKSVFSNDKSAANFKSFLNFKGREDSEKKQKEDEEKKDKSPVNLKNIALLIGAAAGISVLSFALLKNYRKTLENFDSFVEKYQNCEIEAEIKKAVESADKKSAIANLSAILKRINAKDDQIKENLNKIEGITPKEVQETLNEIKKAQIYVNTPETLGGVTGKTQYYCYINEPRGHLYNWILNPENKFNKYIFLSITALSAAGFIGQEAVGAIKEVMVGRENAKSELNLRKRLVDVEVNNFKAKKMSAVNPLIDNFNLKLKKGEPKEELKELAENILVEIKNGPPYVYS